MRSRKHLGRIAVVVVVVALWVWLVVVVGHDSWLPSWLVSGAIGALSVGLAAAVCGWVGQDRSRKR